MKFLKIVHKIQFAVHNSGDFGEAQWKNLIFCFIRCLPVHTYPKATLTFKVIPTPVQYMVGEKNLTEMLMFPPFSFPEKKGK